MKKYVVRRFFEMLLTLFTVATATFFLLAVVPGDPLTERAEKLPPQIRQNLYKKYGLDKPILERYVITMKGLVHGNFGESILYPGQTVQSIIKDKLPASARLGMQQMFLGITLGLILGVIAAMKRGTWIDYLIVTLAVFVISIPHLILGLWLQNVLAGQLRLFPVIGWPKGKELWFGGWKYTILPTLTGCFAYLSTYARLLKTSMLDVVNNDYILTAKAKGLSSGQVVWRHTIRNAFIPIITILPMSVGMCITGSFFIERVFSIPGIGMYYVDAVNGRDLPIIMGQTIILAAMYIVIIFITDLLYVAVDPRIRIRGGKR